MKRRIGTLCFVVALATVARGETFNGTVVDVMCKGKDLASHTASCGIACSKTGYGLVLPDGKFVKFNESGNAKTLAALKATSKEKDLKAKVTGNLKAGVLQVDTIEIQ
ncbi:MAG TPA: hypothetical protein VE621_05430 [Bryobacteraceae bacterium]|jgi:hypothetical protein|nr:hypothetical protein [Bryobacteraceae bacterium]